MTNGFPGIWIVDATGQTVFADDQMAEILGEASRAAIIGHPSSTYIFPEDMGEVLRVFELKKNGDSAPHQCRLRRKDGSAIEVQIQGTAVHNDAGQFSAVVTMFTPISGESR
jgi:PAS domain S-box-containing protein